MSKELAAATFDYGSLDKDVKGKLLCIAREVKQAKKQHSASGLLIGESIAMAHSLLAGDGRDGEFNHWVSSECGFGRTTAYNYMWAWQRFGKCSTVEHFDDGALYALASPKAPPEAAKEAEKLADKGQKITLDRAKELLDQFSDKPKGSSRSPSPKKLPSQSDEPPTPAEDAPPQDEPIEAPAVKTNAVKQYNDAFDADEYTRPAIADLARLQRPYDEMLNARTAMVNAWNVITSDERDGVYAVDKRNRVDQLLKDLLGPIAQARPHALCSHCEGKGCTKCKQCGWWPRSVVEGLKK